MFDSAIYNPDILNCLANLSSDEVFTPPEIANQILDELPGDLWSNRNLKVLDPSCKSGVFLREVAKRLMNGLKDDIPDEQERINHILSNQLYGIALTTLTSLVARRTLYCTKVANGPSSICTEFTDEVGNIYFNRIQHTWENGKCRFCNASQQVYDRDDSAETYAYSFIHPDRALDELFNIKFDLIVGGPPYQLYDGGGTGASAKPVYHKFVERAITLNPKYVAMIIPARWYSGGKGLDDFRQSMLSNRQLKCLVDFVDTRDCFPNVDIAGGVCFFVWDRNHTERCAVTTIRGKEKIISQRKLDEFETFVRDNVSVEIIHKVRAKSNLLMDSVVSSRMPFGLASTVRPDRQGDLTILTSSGEGVYKSENVPKGHELIAKWKVLLSKASNDHGGQADKDGTRKVFARIKVMPPNSVCTESYLVVGSYLTRKEAENLADFLKTRFCRFLVSTVLLTHNITKSKFCFVPMMDMKERWTDNRLFEFFNITEREVNFIKKTIREM